MTTQTTNEEIDKIYTVGELKLALRDIPNDVLLGVWCDIELQSHALFLLNKKTLSDGTNKNEKLLLCSARSALSHFHRMPRRLGML